MSTLNVIQPDATFSSTRRAAGLPIPSPNNQLPASAGNNTTTSTLTVAGENNHVITGVTVTLSLNDPNSHRQPTGHHPHGPRRPDGHVLQRNVIRSRSPGLGQSVVQRPRSGGQSGQRHLHADHRRRAPQQHRRHAVRLVGHDHTRMRRSWCSKPVTRWIRTPTARPMRTRSTQLSTRIGYYWPDAG